MRLGRLGISPIIVTKILHQRSELGASGEQGLHELLDRGFVLAVRGCAYTNNFNCLTDMHKKGVGLMLGNLLIGGSLLGLLEMVRHAFGLAKGVLAEVPNSFVDLHEGWDARIKSSWVSQ